MPETSMGEFGPTGRKIDLSQFKKKEQAPTERYDARQTYEKLKQLMSTVSREQNNELREQFGATTDLIEDNGTISFETFGSQEGGVYNQEKIQKDEKFIAGRLREWSGIENDKTRIFRMEKYGINTNLPSEEQNAQIIEGFKAEKAATESARLEMAVSAIFHKILKSKFLVVRSAEPDDFQNGADNVMINKETGEVMCTFDEVSTPEGAERIDEKIKKTGKKNAAFGSTLEYGLTFQKDEAGKSKVVQTKLENIPSFYVAVSPDELKKLLSQMEFDPTKPPSAIELKAFDVFIDSLESQATLALQGNTRGPAQENIRRFKNSLDQIKELRSQFK
jgi:hypothetical protein